MQSDPQAQVMRKSLGGPVGVSHHFTEAQREPPASRTRLNTTTGHHPTYSRRSVRVRGGELAGDRPQKVLDEDRNLPLRELAEASCVGEQDADNLRLECRSSANRRGRRVSGCG